MRLGRSPHDPAWLATAPAHRFGAAPVPVRVDRSAVQVEPMLYGNDVYGDCTAVAMANYARCVAALNGYDLVVDPAAPLRLFSSVAGDPPDLAAVDGVVVADVLAWQDAHGFQVGPQALVARWGRVEVNHLALAHAIDRLGGAYLGVRLYERDMDNVGKVWDVSADPGALVGGHMVNGWDYDPTGVRVGTWGQWQKVTWAWLLERLEEAYGLVWRQLAKADGTFYSGVSADGLVRML